MPTSRISSDQCAPGGAVPKDTAARRCELKFPLPGADVEALCSLLGANTERVKFAGPISTVNSIYFDDDELTSCRESLAGIGRRTKARLRWYDTPFPETQAFFELKRRDNHLITKDRVLIETPETMAASSYSTLMPLIAEHLNEDQRCAIRHRAYPTALVSYKRQHFVDRRSEIRLTVDYEIVSYDQTGCQAPTRRFGVSVEGQVVLEAKIPGNDHASLAELLYPLSPRRSRFSKYVRCCQALGILWCET